MTSKRAVRNFVPWAVRTCALLRLLSSSSFGLFPFTLLTRSFLFLFFLFHFAVYKNRLFVWRGRETDAVERVFWHLRNFPRIICGRFAVPIPFAHPTNGQPLTLPNPSPHRTPPTPNPHPATPHQPSPSPQPNPLPHHIPPQLNPSPHPRPTLTPPQPLTPPHPTPAQPLTPMALSPHRRPSAPAPAYIIHI